MEKANIKLLETIRSFVNSLDDNWEDWLPQIAASINSWVNASTGKFLHRILYGVEKRLPYDLLISDPQPIYNTEDNAQQQIHTLSNIHTRVREKLQATKAEMAAGQYKYKSAIPFGKKKKSRTLTFYVVAHVHRKPYLPLRCYSEATSVYNGTWTRPMLPPQSSYLLLCN